MLKALGQKNGARTLAVLAVVVLVADLALVGARAGGTGGKPVATPTRSVKPTTSARSSAKAQPVKKPVATPRATKKPAVARKSAGCGKPADFNGDGYSDLAIGIPRKDSEGAKDSGAIQIVYGTSTGLKPKGTQIFTQDSFGSLDSSVKQELFGSSLATGDFNGDGYSDLAVGIPGKTLNGSQNVGAVIVMYGSPSGLTPRGAQYWALGSPGIGITPQGGDHFGQSLAAGDFNRDGFADLAIGVPYKDVTNPGHIGQSGAQGNAGAFLELFGSRSGLTASGNHLIDQNFVALTQTAASGDYFSWSLTPGDFDGDGYCDVAAGLPGRTVNGQSGAGAVTIIRGGSSGLGASGAQFWTGASLGHLQSSAQFGFASSSGDFNCDGKSDLSVGVFDQNVGSSTAAGAVGVIYGSSKALTSSGSQFLTLDTPGIKGGPAASSDEFGLATQAGDFFGNGCAALAIGVPYRNSATGEIVVVPGGTHGLTPGGSAVWTQSSPGLGSTGASGDLFGQALTSGDYNKDGKADLVIGAPGKGFSAEETGVGAVNVIFGSSSGLASRGAQFFYEGHGVAGSPDQGDAFGAPLAT